MKIAVFYYSQSGQALQAAKNIFNGVSTDLQECVIYKEIIPIQKYPFPWNKYEFFDSFPETRLGFPPSGIEPIDFSDVQDAEVIAIVGQSWFLSPSLPLQSFFADNDVKDYLQKRKVIFINVCRNMWLMTSRWIKRYMKDVNAILIGQIVLQDEAPNIVSAFTIVRWLMYGNKRPTCVLPEAGVSNNYLYEAKRFGFIIKEAIENNRLELLQKELLNKGAIHYKPSILHIEQIGYKMFGFWANYIRRKGGFRDVKRKGRVTFFYYYLLFALFIISPIVQLLLFVTNPLRNIEENRNRDCNV